MLENELKRLNDNLEKNGNTVSNELKKLNINIEMLLNFYMKSDVTLVQEEIKNTTDKDITIVQEEIKNTTDKDITIVQERLDEVTPIVDNKPKKITKKYLTEQVDMLRLRVIDFIRRGIITTVDVKKILTEQGYENFKLIQKEHLDYWEEKVKEWENTLS